MARGKLPPCDVYDWTHIIKLTPSDGSSNGMGDTCLDFIHKFNQCLLRNNKVDCTSLARTQTLGYLPPYLCSGVTQFPSSPMNSLKRWYFSCKSKGFLMLALSSFNILSFCLYSSKSSRRLSIMFVIFWTTCGSSGSNTCSGCMLDCDCEVEIDETTDEDMCDDVETQSVQGQKGGWGLDGCRYLHFIF
jgi:hypothetical protein